MKPFALQARYVLPMDGRPPMKGGIINISGERITSVGENTTGRPPLDLGDVVLLPGLVNAHTHLEFSHLRTPLGSPGQPLPDWIRDVLTTRQHTVASESGRDPNLAIQAGIQECISTGTTAMGEISTQEVSLPAYASAGAEVTIFHELLGLPKERLPVLKTRAVSHLAQFIESPANLHSALSPHAPYSVHPEIVRWAAEQSKQSQFVVAMHLAESPEEIELLATGTGPFVELLQERGVWSSESLSRVSRPLDYLQMLSHAKQTLVVHGNYLVRNELEYLSAHRSRISLVYCPRTHAYFGHMPYPLKEALELGVSIALGTDSRASNPDLSLLTEMRFVAEKFPEISPDVILRMGTSGGAKALTLENICGTVTPGKLANFTAIELSDRLDCPYESLLRSCGTVRATWIRGKLVFEAN